MNELIQQIKDMAQGWEEDAKEFVPDAYAIRGMERKYFAGDCYAGGLMSAASDIRWLIENLGNYEQVPMNCNTELERRCVNSCRRSEDGERCEGCGRTMEEIRMAFQRQKEGG